MLLENKISPHIQKALQTFIWNLSFENHNS